MTTHNAQAFDIVKLREDMAMDDRKRHRGQMLFGFALACLCAGGGILTKQEFDAWKKKVGQQAIQEILAEAPKDAIAMDAKQLRFKLAAVQNENDRLKDRMATVYAMVSEVE